MHTSKSPPEVAGHLGTFFVNTVKLSLAIKVIASFNQPRFHLTISSPIIPLLDHTVFIQPCTSYLKELTYVKITRGRKEDTISQSEWKRF